MKCTLVERNEKHGGAKTNLYARWKGIFQRVRGTSTGSKKYYVAKGVQVCPEWYAFKNFQKWALSNGFKPELTIDRIDGNSHYSPENCRWVTMAENIANQERYKNR
jgi:hypothetical protein